LKNYMLIGMDDNIKMDLKEMGWQGVDRIHLAQDTDTWWAVVNMVINLWDLSNVAEVFTD